MYVPGSKKKPSNGLSEGLISESQTCRLLKRQSSKTFAPIRESGIRCAEWVFCKTSAFGRSKSCSAEGRVYYDSLILYVSEPARASAQVSVEVFFAKLARANSAFTARGKGVFPDP